MRIIFQLGITQCVAITVWDHNQTYMSRTHTLPNERPRVQIISHASIRTESRFELSTDNTRRIASL
jgi:hypothetical protein